MAIAVTQLPTSSNVTLILSQRPLYILVEEYLSAVSSQAKEKSLLSLEMIHGYLKILYKRLMHTYLAVACISEIEGSCEKETQLLF